MPVRAYPRVDAAPGTKPLIWIASARKDLIAFPEEVVRAMGFALYEARKGNKHPHAKPLRGFGGAGVLEVVEDHDGDTYRVIYTVRLVGRVYVPQAFQKRSKHGISTPKEEIDPMKARLRKAEEQHAEWLLN
jgi:phage-related protein